MVLNRAVTFFHVVYLIIETSGVLVFFPAVNEIPYKHPSPQLIAHLNTRVPHLLIVRYLSDASTFVHTPQGGMRQEVEGMVSFY